MRYFVLAILLFFKNIYRCCIKCIKKIKLYIKGSTKKPSDSNKTYTFFFQHKPFILKMVVCGTLHYGMLVGILVISIGICCIKLIITKVLYQMVLLSQVERIDTESNNAISNSVT